MTPSKLLLASKSPQRQKLLNQIGVDFLIYAPDIDESRHENEVPESMVVRLAKTKAACCLNKMLDREAIVLASDTTVVVEDKIFGKPVDQNDALNMLSLLSGKTHRVLTAVSVTSCSRSKTICSETFVNFRVVNVEEAQAYWETGEPRDKAGAYAIQGFGAAFVESITGSYSGVMGLPLFETVKLLGDFGIRCWKHA